MLGIIAYALLRESYVWFYGQYGVVPEDVGLSQVRMLTGVLRIFHLWTFQIPGSPAVNFLIVLLMIATYLVAGRFLLRWGVERRPELESTVLHQHPALSGCAALLLAVLLTSAWVLPNDRYYAGSKLQRRQGVRPSQLGWHHPATEASRAARDLGPR